MEFNSIIRKLGNKEVGVLKRPSSKNFISNFRIETKFDLFKNIKIVKEAIQTWKTLHDFLRAKIVQQNDDYYFILNENCEVNKSLKNVQFLKFDSSSMRFRNEDEFRKTLDELSILLIEKELSNLIDPLNEDLLWRMIFLDLSAESLDKYEYEVIILYHHTISEGKCSFANFLQLLNIIEKKYKNEDLNLIKYNILPSTEDLFVDFTNQAKSSIQIPKILRPTFLNHNQYLNKSLSSSLDNLKQFEIDSAKLKPFDEFSNEISIRELIDISKNNYSKIKRFIIDTELTQKLINKSKEEGVKLTNCLSMIINLSFIKLYNKHGLDLKEICYFIPIALRNFKTKLGNGLIDNETMGYYVGGLMTIFTNEFNAIRNDEELKTKFWILAKKYDQEFQERVLNDQEKFCFKFKELEDPENELNFHYGISNIGVLKNEKNSLFKITQSFLISSTCKDLKNRFFFNMISTIENKINWLIGFNSYFIHEQIINDMIKFYFENLEKILQ